MCWRSASAEDDRAWWKFLSEAKAVILERSEGSAVPMLKEHPLRLITLEAFVYNKCSRYKAPSAKLP
jgi:hypothetical protein